MNRDSEAIYTSLHRLCLRLGAWIGLSESPTCLVCIFCSIIKLFPSSLKMRTLSYRPVSVQLFSRTSLWTTEFTSHSRLYNFSASSQSMWSFRPSSAIVQIFSSFFCCQAWSVVATPLDAAPCGSRRYSLHLVQTHMLPVFLQKCDGTEPRVPTKQLCAHLYLSWCTKEALDRDNMVWWLSFKKTQKVVYSFTQIRNICAE